MHSSIVLASLPQLLEKLFDDFVVFVGHLWVTFLSCILYVLLELCVLDEGENGFFIFQQGLVVNLVFLHVGVVFYVRVDHESAQVMINLFIHLILNHIEDVETG